MARIKKRAPLPIPGSEKPKQRRGLKWMLDRKKYDTALWKNARSLHLFHYPFCEPCLLNGEKHAGTSIDHVIPVSMGGAFLDPRNFQTIREHPCHSKKSGSEAAGKCERWVLNERGEKIPYRNKDKKMKY